MIKRPGKKRAPAVLKADDPKLIIETVSPEDDPAPFTSAEEEPAPASIPHSTAIKRGVKWGGILLSAFSALIALAAGLWLNDLILGLLAREDWLGWLALGLLSLAALSCTMIMLAEVWALMKLRRLGRLKDDAESAVNHAQKEKAKTVSASIKRLYGSRPDLAWGRSRLTEHEHDIMDARELLILTERELILPLDTQAREIIAASAKRVSVITAISPSTFIDMIFVAVQNLRMLRRIAAVYGARPGTLGLVKLARMVMTHIVLTGGMAIGDGLIQQMIGHRLTAKLSVRLGEGVFNGALTARIGLAALDVCRPLPYLEVRRPRLRDLLTLLVK